MTYKGILIPIGGNEDKGLDNKETHTLEFVKDSILARVVNESGGIHAKIFIIPTASSIPVEVGEMYTEAFTRLGCTDFEILNLQKREECEDPVTIRKIESADCVMFSGGDQSRIADIIGGSTIHNVLIRRYKEDPIVIAGTSAGAMMMSQEMISGGSSTDALIKGSVRMREGMGFIPGLIIDSHFIKRGRFGRLAEALAQHPSLVGIGLAENTGIIIRNREECKVIGTGMVIIFDPTHLTHNNAEILPDGMPMTIAGITTHVLANSDSYNLKTKKVSVLPIEAEFEI